jgi:hypothetical protein
VCRHALLTPRDGGKQLMGEPAPHPPGCRVFVQQQKPQQAAFTDQGQGAALAAGALLGIEALLLLPQAGKRPGDRLLAKGGCDISGREPGLTVLIGAHPNAVPLERVWHQSGRAAHG